MTTDLEREILSFYENLEQINELHHPNDYRRLYNIALIACCNNEKIPYDKMKKCLECAIKERNLNRCRFELAHTQYISTLEIAYDIIKRMKEQQVVIPNNMRF